MRPAILGGEPAFNELLPLSRPHVGRKDQVLSRISKMLDSGHLTDGPSAQELEKAVSRRLGVECAAVASCTTGLILAVKALGLSGEVIMPSFTFFATGHALLWNGLEPVFADCERGTLTLDPQSAERLVTPRTCAILAVNIFGNPPDFPALRRVAERAGVPLLVDAAQGFGSQSQGVPAGTLGDVEVFSMTPSKLVAAGEGGLVVTRDQALADRVRVLRNYGNAGDYNPEWLGLNGRLSELHAAVALQSLEVLEEHIALRQAAAQRYQKNLASLQGLRVQEVRSGDRSVYKDMGVFVQPEFGLSRDLLHSALLAEHIQTRRYFYPPLHRQHLYRSFVPREPLPHTETASDQTLCLPISAALSLQDIDRVCEAIARIHSHASEIRSAAEIPSRRPMSLTS